MAGPTTTRHSNLATPAADQAERQRAILARLIASVEPADCECIARALFAEFRSIGRIWSAAPESLRRVLGGLSPVVALIVGARDAALETMAADLRGVAIDPFSPNLRRYLITSMGSLADETLRIFFLDNSRRLIADEQLQNGTLGHLTVYPRPIFRRALEHNAAGLILVHNHPSGDPSPSEEDIAATRHLEKIGRSLDIELVDHIIVTSACAHHIVSQGAVSGTGSPSSLKLRTPPAPRNEGDLAVALANAKVHMNRRLLRQQLIGCPGLLGDAAWEMLVDLFIHQCEGKDLSISSLCVTPSIPLSSGLRLVQKLCDEGIVRRDHDPFDGRRSIIRLEPAIAHRIQAYFEAGPE